MWQKLQPRERVLLAALGVCIVLYAVFYFLLIPQYDTFTKNKNTLSELEAKAKAAENVLASEKAERELAAKSTEKLNEVKPLFNNRMTDGLTVTYIGLEAMRANVQIDSFIPSDIVNKGAFLELPAKFEVSGDYPDVVSFIEKMEGLPNLSDLRSLKIQPEKVVAAPNATAVPNSAKGQLPAATSSNQNGRVTATFDLVIYSSSAPEDRLKLEQTAGWQVGRQNAFKTPDGVSPLSGIDEVPAQTAEPPVSKKEDPLSTFIKQTMN